MKRIRAFVAALVPTMSIAACNRPAHDASDGRMDEAARPAPSVPVAKPALRGALGDNDLRVMFAELASTKACKLVSGQFRPLRALDRPDVVTGLMWIRDCKITNVGTKVTFVLSGNGWQWADQQQHKAGGTFAIQQYVKFAMTATLPGALDVAYDRHDHVLSVWFTPAQPPDVKFTPVGGIDVHAEGIWSSVVGAIGTVFAESPESLAKGEAKDQGGHQLEKELADGLSVTVNLCTGLSRFALGRQPKGKMDVPDAGETKRVPIDLQSNALMVFGPQEVGDAGFTANVESANGTVHVELACRDQAEALAAAYAEGRPLPTIKTLAAKVILGNGSLRIGKANCQVSLIARPATPNGPAVRFDWQRPPAEVARSAGGPLISCGPGVE
jgi:hypothetical protein